MDMIHCCTAPYVAVLRPGEVPAPMLGTLGRRNRCFEYDAVGDTYARFLVEELLPFVAKQFNLNLSTNGNDRCIAGGSSGGIAAFNAAWQRPDAFTRVYANSGSFVVVEVDMLDPEPPETRLAGPLYIIRPPVDSQEFALRPAHIPKLAGEDDLVAPATNRATNQFLVLSHPVHVGGIQESHAQVESPVDGGYRFGLIGWTVKLRHAHATQTQSRNHWSLLS
jgi:Putative esterase